MRRIIVTVAGLGLASLLATGCNSNGSAISTPSTFGPAVASVTADPQFLAAKALVVHCFAGTPVQQARQIHLVFLSSSTGKNGPAVITARAELGTCLGISKSDEQPFFNDAVKAAEQQKPRLHVLHPVVWLTAFFAKTLPPIVIRYSNAPGIGIGPAASPRPSVTASS